MPGIRRRIWFSVCGTLVALLLAIGPLSMTSLTQAAAQGTADDAEALLATASDMADELETVDAPRTLELEQAESDSITLNFLNPSDAPITDFYLTFRAEAPRDGIDDPFDVGVFYRDQGVVYCRHYCPQGNQPILRLDSFDGTVAHFSLVTLTGDRDRAHMHLLTMEFPASNDHVGVEEVYFTGDEPNPSAMRVFERVNEMVFDTN